MNKYLYLILATLFTTTCFASNCLIADLPFSGDANDVFGSYDGTVSGATLTTDRDGNPNSAYSFDGVDDYIDLGSDFDLPQRTISFWINASSSTASGMNIYESDHAGIDYSQLDIKLFEVGGNNQLRIFWGNGMSSNNYIQNINLNEWYHIAIAIDAAVEAKYYINGVHVHTATNLANAHSTNGVSNAVLGSGRNYTHFFHGMIDDFKAFNCVLSDCKIEDLCPSNCQIADFPLDGNANDIIGPYSGNIVGATPTTDRNGNTNSAYSFDGVDDYIDLGSDFDLIQRTISFWVNASSSTASGMNIYESDHAGIDYSQLDIKLNNVAGNNELRIFWGDGMSSNNYSQNINLNEWYHIAIAIDATVEAKYYINGAHVHTATNLADIHSTNGVSHAVLGAGRHHSGHFHGLIDDFKVFDCVLSDCEIEDLCPVPTNTSIEGLSNNTLSNIEVYPNPVVNQLFINTDDTDYIVDILDITGRLYYSVQSKDKINVSSLAEGTYFIILRNDEHIIGREKFIKIR